MSVPFNTALFFPLLHFLNNWHQKLLWNGNANYIFFLPQSDTDSTVYVHDELLRINVFFSSASFLFISLCNSIWKWILMWLCVGSLYTHISKCWFEKYEKYEEYVFSILYFFHIHLILFYFKHGYLVCVCVCVCEQHLTFILSLLTFSCQSDIALGFPFIKAHCHFADTVSVSHLCVCLSRCVVVVVFFVILCSLIATQLRMKIRLFRCDRFFSALPFLWLLFFPFFIIIISSSSSSGGSGLSEYYHSSENHFSI